MQETLGLISLILGITLSVISLATFIFIKKIKGREEKAKLEAKREWEQEQEEKRQAEENARIIKEQERLDQIRNVVKEEFKPIIEAMEDIKNRLDTIEKDNEIQKEALLAEASNSLHHLNKECTLKRFADPFEKIAFGRLYESYRKLGGNHEMKAVSERFFALPDIAPEE